MSLPNVDSLRSQVQTVMALAHLLERIEHSPVPVDADQYQAVVTRLKLALSTPLPDEMLDAVLSPHPAAAEIYENLHYAQAGLSRSPLDRSVESEKATTLALARISRSSKPGNQH